MNAALTLGEYSSRPNRAPCSSPANDADRREPSPAVRRKPSLTLVRCNPNHRPITTTYDVQGRTSVAGGRKPRAANHRFQRTRKVAGTATTVFHYDLEGRLIAETKNTGVLIRAYVYDDQAPIAQFQRDATTQTYTLVHVHTDHLGTPRSATDSVRTTVWTHDPEAFGRGKPETDPDGDTANTNVRLRFPGQYHDGESGLYYNWHRYYDPRIGRYITSDPIGLVGGLNTYAFVNGNPHSFTDPKGTWVLPALVAAAAIYVVIDRAINAYTIYQAGKNINDRIKEVDRFEPPPGKKLTDTNPNTGRPYAVDEWLRSRRDFREVTKDISEGGRATTDILLPGPAEAIKNLPTKACP